MSLPSLGADCAGSESHPREHEGAEGEFRRESPGATLRRATGFAGKSAGDFEEGDGGLDRTTQYCRWRIGEDGSGSESGRKLLGFLQAITIDGSARPGAPSQR